MEEKQFDVAVVFRQTVRYRVSAGDREEAERLATEMWQSGEEGVTRDEWAHLQAVRVAEVRDEEACGQDCEEALRYLRDRELVIETLDQDLFNPTVHDAVSAEDVARRLGWRREDGETDVIRASRALERLCADQRVVCFSRPRVRRGERGEIRLYCTPQHLGRLAALLEPPAAEEGTGEDREAGAEAGTA